MRGEKNPRQCKNKQTKKKTSGTEILIGTIKKDAQYCAFVNYLENSNSTQIFKLRI